MQNLRLESIDLEITTNCNMACSYCYASIDKKDLVRGDMSNETIEQVLDLIVKYGYPKAVQGEKGMNKKPTIVTFYGGEPLLAFERIKYFVERSKERGMELSFSALSNGTIANEEMVKWFKDNKIWVQRSLDGCPEAQEKYRPNSIKKYEEATKIWKDFESSRRMTVQPEFAKLLIKSLRYFESQGFCRGLSPMPNFYIEWTEEQMQDFEKSLWQLGEYYIKCWNEGRPFYCYYFSREMIFRFLEPHKTYWGCGGARGLHCITWDGQITICHRFSREKPESVFYFGTIKEVLDGNAKGYGEEVLKKASMHEAGLRKDWADKCKDCIAQYSCEKGCMHTNFICTGNINTPPELYCRIRRTSARVVTILDSKLRCKDPDWWTRGNYLAQDYARRKQTPEYLVARLGEAVLRVDALKRQLEGGKNGLQKCNSNQGKQ